MTAYFDTVSFASGGEISSTGTFSGMSDYGTDGTDGTISQFSNKKEITLSHSGALTDYQKLITVSYESAMQADFDDIRFNDASGNYINYWIESKTDSDTADIWIKSDYLDGDTIVTMFYGNAGLTSESSGADTFIQWHGVASSSYMDSLVVAPSNIIWESKARNTAATHNVYYGLSNHQTAGDDVLGIQDYNVTNLRYMACANEANFSKVSESPDLVQDQWYKLKITFDGTTAIGYADDDQITAGGVSGNLPNESLGLWMNTFAGTAEQEWSFVRKYTGTEPTYLTGAEQTADAGLIAVLDYIDTQIITIAGIGDVLPASAYVDTNNVTCAGTISALTAYIDTISFTCAGDIETIVIVSGDISFACGGETTVSAIITYSEIVSVAATAISEIVPVVDYTDTNSVTSAGALVTFIGILETIEIVGAGAIEVVGDGTYSYTDTVAIASTGSIIATLGYIDTVEIAGAGEFAAFIGPLETVEIAGAGSVEADYLYKDLVEFTSGGEIFSTDTYSGMSDYGTDGTDGTISQFSNKKEITLSHSGALTDYQKLITVSYESAMQADFDDIRFNDASGNYINYWIESKTDSDTADIWIKSDYLDGDTIVTMFYGNAGLTSESSGADTFIQWHGVASASFIDSLDVPPTNIIYESKFKVTSASHNILPGLSNSQTIADDGQYFQFYDSGNLRRLITENENNATVISEAPDLTPDVYYNIKITNDGTTARGYVDDNEIASGITNNLPNENLGIFVYIATGTYLQDWAFVRKYTGNEPTYLTGAEQINEYELIAIVDYIDSQIITGSGTIDVLLTYLESLAFAGAGSVEAIPALSYADVAAMTGGGVFGTPGTYIFIDMDNLSAIGWNVSKTIQDPLWKLSTQLTGTDAPTPFRHLRVIAPDHNDVDRTVFIGFLPQARTNLSGAGNFTSLNGFDYAWYLTSQYIAEAQRITDEDTDPSVTITAILGGADWAKTTGIEPYNMKTVTDWATIKKSYIFDPNASKWKSIQEICEHTNHVFVVKWVDTGTDFHPVAYFVHEDDIDTELDLPALVTITAPDSEFVSASKESQQVDKINRVVVKGANKITGVWYDSVVESAEVTAGEEIPIEYRHESTDLDTQAKADARATELYAFYNTDSDTYTVQFKQRMDLELYQRMQFSGYADIATGVMRVISIRYGRNAADSDVEVVVTPDQNLSNLRALSRLLGDDFMNTQDRIKEQFFVDLTKIAVGTVQSVDGDEVVVALERDGGLVKGRALS